MDRHRNGSGGVAGICHDVMTADDAIDDEADAAERTDGILASRDG
jgi:hypothetical protein